VVVGELEVARRAQTAVDEREELEAGLDVEANLVEECLSVGELVLAEGRRCWLGKRVEKS